MNKMVLPKNLKTSGGLDEAKQKAIEGFKSDPGVYATIQRLGLSKGQVKEFIGPLLDLQEDMAYCASCPGLANCKKANPHFNVRLELEDGYLDRHYDPCELAQEEAAFEQKYIKHEFPKEWKDYDLSDVDRSKKRNDALLEMSKVIMKKSQRWLYLVGGKRSGKSMMLASFSNMFAERVASPVAFLSSTSLLEELKSLSFDEKEEYAKRFEAYEKCPLLVIDGLGNEFVSEFNFSTFLFPILTYRAQNSLLTCFASSLNFKDLCSLYEAKIGKIRALQLYQLLKDYCVKEIDVSGADIY